MNCQEFITPMKMKIAIAETKVVNALKAAATYNGSLLNMVAATATTSDKGITTTAIAMEA